MGTPITIAPEQTGNWPCAEFRQIMPEFLEHIKNKNRQTGDGF
jgi:hypothetical protein